VEPDRDVIVIELAVRGQAHRIDADELHLMPITEASDSILSSVRGLGVSDIADPRGVQRRRAHASG
jgi:hypothetical protein